MSPTSYQAAPPRVTEARNLLPKPPLSRCGDASRTAGTDAASPPDASLPRAPAHRISHHGVAARRHRVSPRGEDGPRANHVERAAAGRLAAHLAEMRVD